MRLRPVVFACGFAAGAVALLAAAMPALGSPGGAPAATACKAIAFGRAREITLPKNADLAEGGGVYGISCPAAGGCVAGGAYTTTGSLGESFVVSEVRGAWKRSIEVRLPKGAASNPGGEVNGIACAGIGYCVAVGNYANPADQDQSYILTESHGVWGRAANVSLPKGTPAGSGSQLSAVACTGRGSCEAVGNYLDASKNDQAMAVSELAGRWRQAVKITLPANALANPEAFPVSISCLKAGDCVSAGSYEVGPGSDYVPMIATQTRGRWQRAAAIAEPKGARPYGAAMNSVACQSAGHCVGVGFYAVATNSDLGMAATESRGRWGPAAREALSPARHVSASYFDSISCAPAAGCVAAGGYHPSAETSPAFTVVYSSGRWQHATALKLPAKAVERTGLYAISCLRDGYCAVGGYYYNNAGDYLPMVATT
jgi:hypothetical protein